MNSRQDDHETRIVDAELLASSQLASVRAQLSRCLESEGIGGRAQDDALLVLSELATNALIHGAPERRVSVSLLDDAAMIRVADGRPDHPDMVRTRLDGSGGAGLRVVSALAQSWGVRDAEHGKEVWARVRFPGRARHRETSSGRLIQR